MKGSAHSGISSSGQGGPPPRRAPRRAAQRRAEHRGHDAVVQHQRAEAERRPGRAPHVVGLQPGGFGEHADGEVAEQQSGDQAHPRRSPPRSTPSPATAAAAAVHTAALPSRPGVRSSVSRSRQATTR